MADEARAEAGQSYRQLAPTVRRGLQLVKEADEVANDVLKKDGGRRTAGGSPKAEPPGNAGGDSWAPNVHEGFAAGHVA